MSRANRPQEPPTEGLQVPKPKQTLAAYYAGSRMPSPLGGVLQVLGVRPLADGSARLILECDSSSLRYEVPIKKATRTEKTRVKEALQANTDPTCPRHGDRHRLKRIGPRLVCPDCGIAYGKVG